VADSTKPVTVRAAADEPAGGGEDAELVRRAAWGEAAAQRALYDKYRLPAFRVARSFAELDRDDVDDVVQEAFIRGFRNLSSLQDQARFGPWLLTIARNRALTRLARRRSSQEMAEDLGREVQSAEEVVEPHEPTAHAEVEVVRRIIAELPEGPEKETVHLFYVEGKLSAREIAEKLGVGKSAVTMRLERFRAKVKKKVLAEVARLRGEES
jgi:RNA polymerase sigma-70 factor (ECF subfamily)